VSEEQSTANAQLSEREKEILRLVATGASNKEIAAQLFLSVNTVKVHLRNIFGKIGVQSRTEATMYAVRQGWVEVPEASRARPEAEVAAPAPRPRAVEPPLPWPRRIALLVAIVLTVGGLGVTWPRPAGVVNGAHNEFIDSSEGSVPLLSARGDSGWQVGAQMNVPRGRLALAAWRGRLYAIGGVASPGGVTGAVEIYDTAKNTWSSGANKPLPVANISAVLVGDKLIVPGGYTSNGTPTSAVEIYDPAADVWSSGAALPTPVFAYALAVYGGKAYLFGGTDGRSYLGQVWTYDPAADRWTARAPMLTPRGFAAAAALDNAIYVVGGYDGRREFTTCERYWPERDVWESCAPLAIGRGGLALVSLAGRLYALGGGWSGYLAFGERYDPTADAWSPIGTPVTGQWRNLAATSYRMDIFAVGGWNGQSYLATTEKYSPFPFTIFIPSP